MSADRGKLRSRCSSAERTQGYDASRKVYVDLIETGTIDPTKVVRVALENAVRRCQHIPADRSDHDEYT